MKCTMMILCHEFEPWLGQGILEEKISDYKYFITEQLSSSYNLYDHSSPPLGTVIWYVGVLIHQNIMCYIFQGIYNNYSFVYMDINQCQPCCDMIAKLDWYAGVV